MIPLYQIVAKFLVLLVLCGYACAAAGRLFFFVPSGIALLGAPQKQKYRRLPAALPAATLPAKFGASAQATPRRQCYIKQRASWYDPQTLSNPAQAASDVYKTTLRFPVPSGSLADTPPHPLRCRLITDCRNRCANPQQGHPPRRHSKSSGRLDIPIPAQCVPAGVSDPLQIALPVIRQRHLPAHP